MTEWTTLSVRAETAERFKDVKETAAQDIGAADYASDTFLTMLLDTWEDDDIMQNNPVEGDAITEQLDPSAADVAAIAETVDAIEEQVAGLDELGEGRVLPEDVVDELVEEFAVAVEPEQGMVDDSDVAREVARQIDYVELANRVADQIEERMR